jgi:hypothetical protein
MSVKSFSIWVFLALAVFFLYKWIFTGEIETSKKEHSLETVGMTISTLSFETKNDDKLLVTTANLAKLRFPQNITQIMPTVQNEKDMTLEKMISDFKNGVDQTTVANLSMSKIPQGVSQISTPVGIGYTVPFEQMITNYAEQRKQSEIASKINPFASFLFKN